MRPNLKNLRPGSNMVGSTKMYSMFQDLSRRLIETGCWRILDAAQIH